MRHTITLKEIQNHEFSSLMAGSFGKGEHKELKAFAKNSIVTYEVWDQRERVLITNNLAEAVDMYNDC